MSADGRPPAGRRVLITGGSSGIGLACARRLAGVGARVALLARGAEALRQAQKSLPGCVPTIAADVSEASAMRSAVREASARLGGLDAVVADAGAAAYGPFADMAVEDYERTVRITLLGVLNTAHAALPELERSGGVLVVVSSIAGRVPTPWLSAYAAAKHGVRGFVRSLDAELRALHSPVRVALVAPGPVDTPFWRRARTSDRRAAPRLAGVYSADDVAREIERALRRPRPERSVGGLMAAWAFADALAPGPSVAITGRIAQLGWRKRAAHPSDPADALAQPTETARVDGGLHTRPSLLVAARDHLRPGRR